MVIGSPYHVSRMYNNQCLFDWNTRSSRCNVHWKQGESFVLPLILSGRPSDHYCSLLIYNVARSLNIHQCLTRSTTDIKYQDPIYSRLVSTGLSLDCNWTRPSRQSFSLHQLVDTIELMTSVDDVSDLHLNISFERSVPKVVHFVGRI